MKQNRRMISFFYGILYFGIFIGVALHIAVYFYNSCLWIDEVFLARSVLTRDFSSLVASPLDFGQSAPIGYLYIVKTLTVFFGSSETVLRIWSLITGLGSIALLFVILKHGLKLRKGTTLFTTAVFSLLSFFIRYSNEFKPYMSDNFFVLLAVLLFVLHLQEERIALRWVIVAYTGIIWFSFSAVFVIAGSMILIVVRLLLRQKRHQVPLRKSIYSILGCFVVLLSFCAYYFVWLRITSENVGEQAYWDLLRFPLFPKSMDDIRLIRRMIQQILTPITVYKYLGFLCPILAVCFVFFSFRKKEPYLALFLIIVLVLALTASFLGFYPIESRLCQFLSILILLFAAGGLDYLSNWIEEIWKDKKVMMVVWNTAVWIGMFGVLALAGRQGILCAQPERVHHPKSEIRENVNYVKENLTENDFVYLPVYAFKAFEYYMDYSIDVLHPSDKYADTLYPFDTHTTDSDFYRKEIYGHTYAPYIFGRPLFKYIHAEPYSYDSTIVKEAVTADAEEISRHDSVYILTYHDMEGMESLLDELRNTGTVTMVQKSYQTYLYHYVPHNAASGK